MKSIKTNRMIKLDSYWTFESQIALIKIWKGNIGTRTKKEVINNAQNW